MIRAFAVAAVIALAIACRIPDEHLRVRDAGGSGDADVGVCDQTAAWGPLMPVPGLASLRSVARFTSDELTAYFALGPDGTQATQPDTLFLSTRQTLADSFGTATKLTGVNDANGQTTPSISPDGSTIIYTWGEPPAHPMGTDRDIYRATRVGSKFEFSAGVKLPFNLDGFEDDFSFLTPSGDVWFASKRDADNVISIYKALSVGGGQFGAVSYAGDLNSVSALNDYPLLTDDNLHIFFQRDGMVYFASRDTDDESFGTPDTVDELNTDPACVGTNCRPAWISPDACRLYIGTGPSSGAVTMVMSTKPANP